MTRNPYVSIAKQWFEQWRSVLAIVFIVNLAAYAIYITHMTYSVDDYDTIFQPSNTIVSGRWVIDFIHNVVFQKNLMPMLMPILCIAVLILTGLGLCRFWKIDNKIVAGMVISLWSIHPFFFEAYNFRFAAFSFALGYGLATAALLAAERGKRGMILSILLFYLTLSTYQPIIGFAAAAAMVQILLECVRNRFSKEAIRFCVRRSIQYLLVAVGSVVLYLVLTRIIFAVFDVEVNVRFSGSLIQTKELLFEKTGWIFIMLMVRLLPISEYIMPLQVKIAIFSVYVLGTVCIIQGRSRWAYMPVVLVWLVLIPLAAIAPMLPLRLSMSDLPWRVCLGLAVFMIGLFVLTQESPSRWIRKTGFALSVFLLVMFVLAGNKVFYQHYLSNQKDARTAMQMLTRLQQQEDYRPGMPLAVVGRLQSDSFSKDGKTTWQIIQEYTKHCSTRRYSLAQSAFETDWSKYSFLLDYSGLELRRCSSEQMEQARQVAQTRSAWPEPSSVFIQDNIAVIVLSQSDQ